MGDNIWLDDRDGVRTPMQWDAGPNAGFSTAPPERLYAPLIADERFGYARVNVAAQRADPDSLWHTLRRMIAARKQHHIFGRGTCEFLAPQNRAVLAVLRAFADETILALHNLSPGDQSVRLDLSRWAGARVHDLLAARAWPDVGPDPYSLTLPPYGYCWLKLESLAGG